MFDDQQLWKRDAWNPPLLPPRCDSNLFSLLTVELTRGRLTPAQYDLALAHSAAFREEVEA